MPVIFQCVKCGVKYDATKDHNCVDYRSPTDMINDSQCKPKIIEHNHFM